MTAGNHDAVADNAINEADVRRSYLIMDLLQMCELALSSGSPAASHASQNVIRHIKELAEQNHDRMELSWQCGNPTRSN